MLQRYFQLLKEGHPVALLNIHLQYNKPIFWIGKSFIKDEFVIENLVQDTFLKLWEQRDTIQSPEHVFFFLRFVMKRECIHYYSRPKNQFYRQVNSLERYDHYQDYLAGYDPVKESEYQTDQQQEQQDFERVQNVLPLLDPAKRQLIHLCLKYGFQYKAIAGVMGISITETSNKVKSAIKDLKTILNRDSSITLEKKLVIALKVSNEMTCQQEQVLELRCVKKYSFAAIATELELSQKEVHALFMEGYKIRQEKNEAQLESA